MFPSFNSMGATNLFMINLIVLNCGAVMMKSTQCRLYLNTLSLLASKQESSSLMFTFC